MNPLYQSLMGNGLPINNSVGFNSPFEKMNMIFQAMKNPAQFVRNSIPDLPENISHDPQKILNYLQQTRGISNEQINTLLNQFGSMPRY